MTSTSPSEVNEFSSNGYAPKYQLMVGHKGPAARQWEVWQLPSPASPHLKRAKRVAGLEGRNLDLVEHRLVRGLRANGLDVATLKPGTAKKFEVDETQALRLGLLFRLLAPMRSRNNMISCADGIEAMGKEEAAYWLGMALHRKYPRRVLMALRFLLIDPRKV